MRKIILASASPRRKSLLKKFGIRFKAIKSSVDEGYLLKKIQKFKGRRYTDLAEILSFAKALSVAAGKKEIICGFDTIVVCRNKIINKPKNKKDALKKILFLSNKPHKVITGICIIDLYKKKIFLNHETTTVKMKNVSTKEAIQYVNAGESLDKAGGYAIQGKGKKLIKSIKGDYYNVVGLPINRFLKMLSLTKT